MNTLNATLVDRETGVPLSNEQSYSVHARSFVLIPQRVQRGRFPRAGENSFEENSLLFFEDLYQGNERVAFHRDINSREQSVEGGEEPKKPRMARTGAVSNSRGDGYHLAREWD